MKVLLINMPFGAVRPAIGPSLLKAALDARGWPTTIAYLNLRFARSLGVQDFTYIADRSPTQSLAGDWVFAETLFGPRPDEEYLNVFRERFGRFGPCDAQIATLRRARRHAGPFIEECLREIDWAHYDVIGFTSTFTQNVASLSLARRIKQEHPTKTIVFGGANCENEMGVALHRMFGWVDFVCSGEGDISFPALIEALESGAGPHAVPGIISRRDGESVYVSLTPERVRDLDVLPYPDFTDYFEQLPGTGAAGDSILMESSRGCWWGEKHHCTFCGLNGSAMTFRSKSADRVLAEITEQTRRYPASQVEMVDNILDMAYFRDLLPELARRQLKLGLFYETKANLTKDQVREMLAAGVTAIQPGIESFSTPVLRIMRKGTTAMQNIQLLKWCRELGMKVYWNLLYGFPGEDPEDYREMAAVVAQLTHLDPPQGLGSIRLDRFSPNFESSGALGFSNVRPDRSYGYVYGRPESELMQLAYYFEHDYADARDPHDYVAGVETEMRRWFGAAGGRGLVSVDHGEHLAVWDFRPVAVRRLTVLRGAERALYLFCDAQHALPAITTFGAGQGMTAEAVRETLDRLVADRLMLALDRRYLSLAVARPGRPAGSVPVLGF
ncbi:RiPP maturation radical SAM C-methyltransferase [Kineosporia sp. J2-2]|uniref:RiPP maturation radical SAM C-methyltransferase n=1 Tax=Kineosporia corallincola TaxID=2835133 RepID=A0ABS5TDA3_9ACTN|nr:RiPP maturation radical SAM C-methyltransferase [Kineosporia corallincola]MBT0769062.1 RiPP maturation radical SAM C-methyltransferase [Kineosporia corallincola]